MSIYFTHRCKNNLCYSPDFSYGNCKAASCDAVQQKCACRIDATADVNALCAGKAQCSVPARSFSTDPCNGENKYMEVTYTCSAGEC